MQWEAKKGQTKDARKGLGCLGLRGHPSAERFAPGEQRHRRKPCLGFGDCGSNRCMCNWRWIRPTAPLLHVWELIPQGGNAALAKARRDGSHEWVCHAGASTMREDEARAVTL